MASSPSPLLILLGVGVGAGILLAMSQKAQAAEAKAVRATQPNVSPEALALWDSGQQPAVVTQTKAQVQQAAFAYQRAQDAKVRAYQASQRSPVVQVANATAARVSTAAKALVAPAPAPVKVVPVSPKPVPTTAAKKPLKGLKGLKGIFSKKKKASVSGMGVPRFDRADVFTDMPSSRRRRFTDPMTAGYDAGTGFDGGAGYDGR